MSLVNVTICKSAFLAGRFWQLLTGDLHAEAHATFKKLCEGARPEILRLPRIW